MAKRDYKKEYEKFQSSEEQKRKRAGRNKVRRKAIKNGTVKKGDGMDMSHTKNGVVKKPRSVNRGSKKIRLAINVPGARVKRKTNLRKADRYLS
jgi:hypothetical protein